MSDTDHELRQSLGSGDLHVIETAAEFEQAVAAIVAGTGPIAVDAERASGFRYSQRAYLIQVFRRGAGTFLFDPPALGSLAPLGEAIRHDEWVLHAASQDLACLREVGMGPSTIFDTELAARLLGYPRVGLGHIVHELLGVQLAKAHSAADWSTRPLPHSWLAYAALDVELLVDLRDEIDRRLHEDSKAEIARQEFDAVLAKEAKPANAEPWRRLSGLSTLRGGRALAIARELWLARDDLARSSDTAPGRLVPDSSLVAIAKTLPSSKRELAAMKDFTGRASRSELDRWWEALERGRTAAELPTFQRPSDVLPPPRSWSDRNPEADARLKAAKTTLTALSEHFHIPLENLLTPELLRRLAWEPPRPLTVAAVSAQLESVGARPWQIALTAEAVTEAFVGADQASAADASHES